MSQNLPVVGDRDLLKALVDSSPRKAGRTSPQHNLASAVEMLKQVWDNLQYEGPIDRDTLSKSLGHESSKSGSVGVKIGSLTHFHLLEAAPGGQYKLSPIGKEIVLPLSEDDKRRALASAAKSPTLYQEICRDFEGKAIPPALPSLLVRKYGVAAGNADDVSKVFRTSMEYAGLLHHGILQANPQAKADGSDSPEAPPTSPLAGPVVGAAATHTPGAFSIPLSKGRLAHLALPRPVEQSDLSRIKAWIDLMADVLTEDQAADVPKELDR